MPRWGTRSDFIWIDLEIKSFTLIENISSQKIKESSVELFKILRGILSIYNIHSNTIKENQVSADDDEYATKADVQTLTVDDGNNDR